MHCILKERDLILFMVLMESCSLSWSWYQRALVWEESWRLSRGSESRELDSRDSKPIQHRRRALTDSLPYSLFRNAPPLLTFSLFHLCAFIFPFSSQFPSVPYMPFTCVSVIAGVFLRAHAWWACVLLSCLLDTYERCGLCVSSVIWAFPMYTLIIRVVLGV